MPRTIEVNGKKRSVATEAELLAFANSIREAGGANVLGALLPSQPENPDQCLIANALNFGCEVNSRTDGEKFKDGSLKWTMELPHNLTPEQRLALGAVKGVRLIRKYPSYHLTLPKHIGNAAEAFDHRAAFQSYALKPAL